MNMKLRKRENSVLFVDDEIFFLKAIQRETDDEPYKKYFAESAPKALKILESIQISAIVSDLQMPTMNGMELLKIVKKCYPDVIRIIVTGASDVTSILSNIYSGQTFLYITKPLKIRTVLIPIIRQALMLYNTREDKKKLMSKLIESNNLLMQKNKELNLLRQFNEDSNIKKTELLHQVLTEMGPFLNELVSSVNDIDYLKEECNKTQFVNFVKKKETVIRSILEDIDLILSEMYLY